MLDEGNYHTITHHVDLAGGSKMSRRRIDELFVFAMGVDTAEIGQSKVWGALAQLPDPLYPPPLHELRRRRRSRDAVLLGPRLAAKKKTES